MAPTMKPLFSTLLLLAILGWASGDTTHASEPLQASIEKTWTLDDARNEAFRDAPEFIDISVYAPVDPNLLANRQAMQQGIGKSGKMLKVGNRLIGLFSDGAYSSVELCSRESFNYSSVGKLRTVDIDSSPVYGSPDCPSTLPIKSYKYLADPESGQPGALVSIGMRVSKTEIYVFNPDGTLSGHWINNKCYQADGSSCGTVRAFIK